MKIRLNGRLNLYEYGIDFRNLDIELVDNSKCVYEEYDEESDFSELIALDEYLDEMIEDYTEVIEYTDVDIKQTLIAMAYEILGL